MAARPRGRQRCVQLPPGHSCSCQCLSQPLGRSVPGLVLVVPAIEIIVKNHDAPGRHSSHDTPEGSRFSGEKRPRASCNSLCAQPEATPESCTTEPSTSIPVLQSHLGFPRLFLGWFLGGIGAGMKPWCRKGRKSVHFSFYCTS